MAEKIVDIRRGLRYSANAVPKCAVQSIKAFQTQVLADRQNVLIRNNSFSQGDMELELWELSSCPSIDIEPTSPIAALLCSIAISHRVTINLVHQAGHFDWARSRLSVARKNNGVIRYWVNASHMVLKPFLRISEAASFCQQRGRTSHCTVQMGCCNVVTSNLPNGLTSSGLLSRQAARGYSDPLT